jgi:hypothetical protein
MHNIQANTTNVITELNPIQNKVTEPLRYHRELTLYSSSHMTRHVPSLVVTSFQNRFVWRSADVFRGPAYAKILGRTSCGQNVSRNRKSAAASLAAAAAAAASDSSIVLVFASALAWFELDTALLRLLRRPRGAPTEAESWRNLLPNVLAEDEDDGEVLSGLLRDSRFNSDDDDFFWMDGGSNGRGFMEERR